MAQDTTKGFVFFYDYRKHLSILSDEECGRLLKALLDYGETGKEPELDGAALMAFSFISSQIDRDAEKYAEICRRRREAGKKGGRPKADGSEEEAKKSEAFEGEGEKPKDTEENQEETKKPNGFENNQDKAKKANTKTNTKNKTKTNTNTKTNTKTNTSSSKEEERNTSSSSDEKKKKAPKGAEAEEDATPYQAIVNLYHDICYSYPQLKSLTSKRKNLMAARWKEYEGDLEVFRELFTKAEDSSFLTGGGDNGWKADFNWMMDSDNMGLILEGKYDDKEEIQSFDVNKFLSYAQKRENPPATAGTCSVIREKAERLRAMLE